jgi:TRAP-type C4-dicarboxylate transport system substrate-binding protein
VEKIVKDAAHEAAVHERAWVAANESRQLADIKKNGIQVVETPDLASFKNAVQSVYDKYPQYADGLKKIRQILGQ